MISINGTKSRIFIATASLLILSLLGFALYNNYNKGATVNEDTSKPATSVNDEPATEEDQKIADGKKQENLNRESSAQQQTGKKSVTPVITSAGQYDNEVEARGYIPGIFEKNGSCKYTFKKGTKTIERSVAAVENAQSVTCPAAVVPSSEFSDKGRWEVVLSYVSATSEGASVAKAFEVR